MIYEEFKGTGAYGATPQSQARGAAHLPRPSISSVLAPAVRNLLDKETLRKVWLMRRMISQMMTGFATTQGYDITAAHEALLAQMRKTCAPIASSLIFSPRISSRHSGRLETPCVFCDIVRGKVEADVISMMRG